ncbi:uncharacterized protein LOC122573718 [Bombus pyrosoma]|uniref:uncharacterized protein LOC122573718 n=1 Tax=Bombus pyrosoma TaxID=396416 RepID=UPI001CB92DF2|nr:uncharacterized protein LOC122573718 [Bombus pyrosoma]
MKNCHSSILLAIVAHDHNLGDRQKDSSIWTGATGRSGGPILGDAMRKRTKKTGEERREHGQTRRLRCSSVTCNRPQRCFLPFAYRGVRDLDEYEENEKYNMIRVTQEFPFYVYQVYLQLIC